MKSTLPSFMSKSNPSIRLQSQEETKELKQSKLFEEHIYSHILNRPIQKKMRKYSNISSHSKASSSTNNTYFSNKQYYDNIKDNEDEFYISDLSLDGSVNEENNFSFDSSDNENETQTFDETTLRGNDNNSKQMINKMI